MNDDMKFLRLALRLLTQFSGAALVVFWMLGYEYMYGSGHGLHPALAGAGFAAALALPWLLTEDTI